MEKKQDNKVEYYFGSKPVLERAEDEDEFEGSLTKSSELQNLAIIHEIPSAFWRSIWLYLITQGTLTITEPNFELGELDFVTNPMNNAFRKVLRDPIWKQNTESARHQGWNWTGARYVNVYDLVGAENFEGVVSLYISLYTINFGPRFIMQLSEMMQDPADQLHIRTWKDLWDEATTGFEHDIDTVVKHSDGPERVISFSYGYQNLHRIWIAKKGKFWYVVTAGEHAVIPQSNGEIIIRSSSLNGTTIRSAQFYKKGDDFRSFFDPVEGYLVLGNSSDITGRIAIMDAVPSVQIWPGFLSLYSRGAKAIAYMTDTLVPGQYFCIWTYEDLSTFNISIVEVTRDDFTPVINALNNGEQIFVTLTSQGNEWTDVIVNSVATIVVFRVIFGGCSVGLMIYSLYKLVRFIRAQGSHFNVPQVCLALEFIANAWRILFVVVDPFGCFYIFGGALDSFLDTISLPYSTATFVLITFYWHEALSDTSIRIYPFLAKLKIPFFVIMLTLIGADLVVSLTGFYYGTESSALTIIYVLISAGFIIFYFVTIGKITKRLQRAEGIRNGGRRFRRLSSMMQKMILNGVSKTSMVMLGIVYVFRDVNSRPVPQFIGVTLLTATIYFDSFARIFLFDVKKSSKSSSHIATSMSRQPSLAALTQNIQPTNESAPATVASVV